MRFDVVTGGRVEVKATAGSGPSSVFSFAGHRGTGALGVGVAGVGCVVLEDFVAAAAPARRGNGFEARLDLVAAEC